MPVVLLRAADFSISGYESPEELEANDALRKRVESIRLQAGPLMNLGNVENKTVPKMSLVAAAQNGGTIATRTFIPHRVHQTIGVLGAASVAAACSIPGTVAHAITSAANVPLSGSLEIEHPGGRFTVDIDVVAENGQYGVRRSALLRTARKLMQGTVFVPASVEIGK